MPPGSSVFDLLENVLRSTLTLSLKFPTLFPLEHVSPSGLSSTSQFVVQYKLSSLLTISETLQNENLWNVSKSYTSVVGIFSLVFLPSSLSPLHLTPLDTPEVGPGTTLGPSGPSGSASTGPTNAYPFTPLQVLHRTPSSVSRGSSSNSATPIPLGRYSSNTEAITGGVAGSIATLSIVIAALLFYLPRRHSPSPLTPSTNNGQPSGFNPLMDQVPRPMSGQGTIASSLPETTTSLLRVYVCVFAALAPLMCAHEFCYNAQNTDDPTTYPTSQATSPPPTYILTRSPSLPFSRIYTPLPPRRIPKDRYPDIAAFPLSELTIRNHQVVWQG